MSSEQPNQISIFVPAEKYRVFFGKARVSTTVVTTTVIEMLPNKANTKQQPMKRINRELANLGKAPPPVVEKRKSAAWASVRMSSFQQDADEASEEWLSKVAEKPLSNEEQIEVLAPHARTENRESDDEEEEGEIQEPVQAQKKQNMSRVDDDDDTSSLGFRLTSGIVTCVPCWNAVSGGGGNMRQGVVHTLFRHEKMIRALWTLWAEHYSLKTGTEAWREESAQMAQLRFILAENGIAWDERCESLIFPFDRSHRVTRGMSAEQEAKCRSRAWTDTDSVAMVEVFVDGNVREAIKCAVPVILNINASHKDVMKAKTFASVVVMSTIVFIHEVAGRRAVHRGSTLAQVEREFKAQQKDNVVYEFAKKAGFKAALACCPELQERHSTPETRIREKVNCDPAVQHKLNAVMNSSMKMCMAENCICSALRLCDEPAAADYVWPNVLYSLEQMEVAFPGGRHIIRPCVVKHSAWPEFQPLAKNAVQQKRATEVLDTQLSFDAFFPEMDLKKGEVSVFDDMDLPVRPSREFAEVFQNESFVNKKVGVLDLTNSPFPIGDMWSDLN